MDLSIKIAAEVDKFDIGACKFTVDRPLFPGYVQFESKQEAEGSPLAEALFALGGVDGVTIAGNIVTVHKAGTEEWPVVGKKIGSAIRELLHSGGALVSAKLKKPAIPPEKLRAKVQDVLDTTINPSVATHGGYIEILDVVDNNVFLRMGGGCQGCGAASVTLKQGVEGLIRERIPEVANIYDTTDHAAGTNPYYAPAK